MACASGIMRVYTTAELQAAVRLCEEKFGEQGHLRQRQYQQLEDVDMDVMTPRNEKSIVVDNLILKLIN